MSNKSYNETALQVLNISSLGVITPKKGVSVGVIVNVLEFGGIFDQNDAKFRLLD